MRFLVAIRVFTQANAQLLVVPTLLLGSCYLIILLFLIYFYDQLT